MRDSNPNYEEDSIAPDNDCRALVVCIPPPVKASGRRQGSNSGKRIASPHRLQLIVIVVDDSGSMKRCGKCKAATQAVQELIAQAKLKSLGGRTCFLLLIIWYGDYVYGDNALSFVPVSDIDEDDIYFDGSSGGTRMVRVTSFLETEVVARFNNEYLLPHPEAHRVPPPLIFFLSDGYNGDGDPLPIAQRITNTPLANGIPPLLVTVGIEYGGGEPHVELLTKMASKTEDGLPLYYDITNASELESFLSTVGSSAAASADEVHREAQSVNHRWLKPRKGA